MDGNIYALNRHMDEYDYMLMKDAAIEKELERRKQIALKKLETIISPAFSDNFAKLLVESYKEGLEDCDIIVKELNITEQDLLALEGDDRGIFESLCEDEQLYDPYVNYRYSYA